MKVAVFDLGTNTFKLLIAQLSVANNVTPLLEKELSVKLGQKEINNNRITPEASKRGLNAFHQLYEIAAYHQVEKSLAVATSALRSTTNGYQFIEQINQHFSVQLQVITGEEEAECIYRGVKQGGINPPAPFLILDIGGGSTEFIIADNQKWYWKESFNLGIARMLEWFQPSNPIRREEVHRVHQFISEKLASYFEAVQTWQPNALIGCAGTFQTYRSMLHTKYPSIYPNSGTPPVININKEDFHEIHAKLIHSTSKEREKMKGLKIYRVEMIVLASIFVNFIMEKSNIQHLYQSDYALKEGIIDKYITNKH